MPLLIAQSWLTVVHFTYLKYPKIFFVRFGEESMSRVLGWMQTAKIPENAAILDIGTGNGAFLVELVRKELQ